MSEMKLSSSLSPLASLSSFFSLYHSVSACPPPPSLLFSLPLSLLSLPPSFLSLPVSVDLPLPLFLCLYPLRSLSLSLSLSLSSFPLSFLSPFSPHFPLLSLYHSVSAYLLSPLLLSPTFSFSSPFTPQFPSFLSTTLCLPTPPTPLSLPPPFSLSPVSFCLHASPPPAPTPSSRVHLRILIFSLP